MATKKESPKTAAAKKPVTPAKSDAKKAAPAVKADAKKSAPAAKPAAKPTAGKTDVKKAAPAAKTEAKKPAPVAKANVKKAPPAEKSKTATPAAKPGAKKPAPSSQPAAVAATPAIEAKESAKETPITPKTAPAGRVSAVSKNPKAAQTEKWATRQAEIEAKKAERMAATKESADARAAKLADSKAKIDAQKAERAAAIKAAADARAAKLAEIKAANEAKLAARTTPKPATERKPAAPRPEKPARPAPGKPAPSAAANFDIGLSIRLDQNWDQVMQTALNAAAKSAAQQLGSILSINPEADQKTQRALENDKRKLIRILERGVNTAFTRLLEPNDLSISQLEVSADGSRALVPAKKLEGNAFSKAKVVSTYKDLVGMIGDKNSPLKQFGLTKPEIVLNFGDALTDGYFLSGSFKLKLDYANAGASTVEQHYHLFGKRGKELGPQLKVGFQHDLAGKTYTGKLEADFPIKKADS